MMLRMFLLALEGCNCCGKGWLCGQGCKPDPQSHDALGNLGPDAEEGNATAKQRCCACNLDQRVGNLGVDHRYTCDIQQHGLRLVVADTLQDGFEHLPGSIRVDHAN